MCTCPIPLKRSRPPWPNISAVPLNIFKKKKNRRRKRKKPWGNFFKCGADVCLDLRLIALKIYWSKGQGCVRITAEGIKFVEGNKDVSSTGPFQLNGGRWVLLTSRERQWSGCVVWGNNVTRYHWSYWRCVRERKNCLRMQGFFANTIQRRAWPPFAALQFSLNLFRWEELNKPDAARTVSRFANILYSPRWRLDRLWGKRLNGSYQWATFVNNQNGCCRWAICSGFLEKMQLSYIYIYKKTS